MRPVARLALALALLYGAGTSRALGAALSLPTEVAGLGASVPLTVSFTSQGAAISGLQFDLVFDDAALSLSAVEGKASRSSGKSLLVAALASNRVRFLIWEFNQDPISDGDIVDLFANTGFRAALGVTQIHFESAMATDSAGNALPLSTSDGAITIESAAAAAPIVPEGVLNGASLLPGPVAPGEVVTIMGSGIGPPALPNPRVAFDGSPAPLLYAGPSQVNAVVPFGMAGHTTASMAVANASGASITIAVPVADSAPAIFTLTGDGSGPGAILNQDFAVNSPANPAARGSIIMIFATGAGQTNPPGADGTFPVAVLPKPLLPVSVQIGGQPAIVLYAGAAPSLISGVLQVNCGVPALVAAGTAVPVLLTVGDAVSPPVTLAVK